jgi:hypothetical protein
VFNLDLSDEIAKALSEYSEEVDEKIKKVIDVVAKETKNNLSQNPIIPKKSGDYKKSFYVKKLAEGKGYKRVVIANKKYQITHLLENGHALKKGGRSKEYPHWKQAEELAQVKYEELLKRELSK